MKLSVVIPAYNEEKYIDACIRSCLADAPPELLEIIVVDNASTDRTAAIARKFPKVRVVYEPWKGLTRARARGLKEMRGDVFVSLDADTRVRRGWFTAMMRDLKKPGVVCVSGPYHFYDMPRWKRTLVSMYWDSAAKITYAWTKYMVTGGNFAVWKDALVRAGGFDTSIDFYGEDTDIAKRLHGVGKVLFDWNCVMDTSGRRITSEGFVKIPVVYALNYVWIAAFKKPLTRTYKDIR